MEFLQEIIKLIMDNGIGLIILALVVYFAWHFGQVGLDFVKQKTFITKCDESIKQRNEINSEIEEILRHLLLQTHANRAYVFEFKNGTAYLGGLGDYKMDCTYEVLDGSTKSQMPSRQNMPFSLFQSFIDMLTTNDFLIMNVDNRTEDYSAVVYETLVQMGITTTVRIQIMDTKKRVIGYIGIDYCKNPKSEDSIRESVKPVQTAALELGALLSVNKK